MKRLTFSRIAKLQKTYGVDRMQSMINDGTCWTMEGSQGRFAMSLLEAGTCMLPVLPLQNGSQLSHWARNILFNSC